MILSFYCFIEISLEKMSAKYFLSYKEFVESKSIYISENVFILVKTGGGVPKKLTYPDYHKEAALVLLLGTCLQCLPMMASFMRQL